MGGFDGQGLTVKVGCLVSFIIISPASPVKSLISGNLQATEDAFAALRHDGRVITWGCSKSGGDSCAVQEQLDSIEMLAGSVGAKMDQNQSQDR